MLHDPVIGAESDGVAAWPDLACASDRFVLCEYDYTHSELLYDFLSMHGLGASIISLCVPSLCFSLGHVGIHLWKKVLNDGMGAELTQGIIR